MKRKSSKPAGQQRIALERISILFNEAKKMFPREPKYAHRYVQLARKIALKYKVKFAPEQKKKFCKKCQHFLVQGKNVRVRTQEGHLVYTCLDCENVMRYTYRE